MVRIRTADELILNAIDFYRTSQPLLDTKPGTVARDLLIDGPSTQLARLYDELARIRTAQSLRLSLGQDIDKYGSNFGAVRKQGSTSTGFVIFTFNSIDVDIPISIGDIVTANNGASFTVNQSVTISPVDSNQHRATASKFRSDLDFVGITDEFAIQIPVTATAPGVLGNISKYSIVSTTSPGVSNVTNIQPFGGGSAAETDQAFKNRILSIFSGANTGTALGYKNAVLADPLVVDALVVEPGDPLMTRDGTVVVEEEDGTKTIVSEGTGGKVDVYVQGIRLVEILDSFIFRDQSNRNDPTDPANDFVLGQLEGDENKTVSRKRIENIESGILPDQPVNDIVEVRGSLSGPNFVEKTVDNLGRISGNYELLKDIGAFGGSPWGFDRLRFIDNKISNFSEEQTKGRFNGQDALTFLDVLEIKDITQNLQVINENSRVSAADRTSVQLAHKPITNVSRVFNLTTGERYVVANQNPDSTGSLNTTGRIKITGNTLPAVSDILQVDYTWIFDYDSFFDFDNFSAVSSNPRAAIDSTDWGFSNSVIREESIVQDFGSLLLVSVTHPLSSVINVNTFVSESGSVSLISGRLGVVVAQSVANVVSVVRDSDQSELFDTNSADGSFSGLTIFLPTDTVAQVGDNVSIVYNAEDVFTINDISGSFDGSQITLPSGVSASAGTIVEVNYIANIKTILNQTLLPSLPALRNLNGFSTLTSPFIGTQPTTHLFSGSDIVQNLRKAPTRLQLTISGSISPGTITVTGTTFTKITDTVFTISSTGLRHNLLSVIKNNLGISSTSQLPSNISVVRVVNVEKVRTTSGLEVLEVESTFDLKGYKIKNNDFVKFEAVENSELSASEFELPVTPNNNTNAPTLGERLRVTFYIKTDNDTESVSFSKSGTQFTQKKFAVIDSIVNSSGFISGPSQSATLTVNNLNQPVSGARYSVPYDYLAPKTNERISIRYNKNSIITSGTLAVEAVRPISADVLVKAKIAIIVNVRFAIIVSDGFLNSTSIVRQNVSDAIISFINAPGNRKFLDESDLINVAANVSGVDRVRPIAFNKDGESGRVLSILAEKNEFITAGFITIDIENR